MPNIFIVRDRSDIARVIRERIRHIRLVPPEGVAWKKFFDDMVTEVSTLPAFKGFDVYEVEAVVRRISTPV